MEACVHTGDSHPVQTKQRCPWPTYYIKILQEARHVYSCGPRDQEVPVNGLFCLRSEPALSFGHRFSPVCPRCSVIYRLGWRFSVRRIDGRITCITSIVKIICHVRIVRVGCPATGNKEGIHLDWQDGFFSSLSPSGLKTPASSQSGQQFSRLNPC